MNIFYILFLISFLVFFYTIFVSTVQTKEGNRNRFKFRFPKIKFPKFKFPRINLSRSARNARKKRDEKKRIEKLINKAKNLYIISVSGNPDYIQIFFDSLKKFFIDNHNIVNKIWLNVNTMTRSYLKEKWQRFIKIKEKIFNDINNNYILTTYDNFLPLCEAPLSKDKTPLFLVSDFSKDVYSNIQQYIETIHSKESFTSCGVDESIDVKYYVNLYDTYAKDAYFNKYDELENILTEYEKFYNKNASDIKKAIEILYKTDSITLAYINQKVIFFLKIINTIHSTNYGKILNS